MSFRELFPTLRMPILQERNRGRSWIFQDHINKEAAVARNIILPAQQRVLAAAPDSGLEQRGGRAGLDRAAFQSNRGSHELCTQRNIVQLLAIGGPAGRNSTVCR